MKRIATGDEGSSGLQDINIFLIPPFEATVREGSIVLGFILTGVAFGEVFTVVIGSAE
jgi:hypothetical protein